MLSVRLRLLAERMSQQLWWLHDALAAREDAERQIAEELEKSRDRLGDVPAFVYDETRATARARYGIEQFQADLMREHRELWMKWLDTRREAENALAELLAEYAETLAKIALATSSPLERPTLASLLGFLDEAAPHEVLVIESSEVKAPAPRIP